MNVKAAFRIAQATPGVVNIMLVLLIFKPDSPYNKITISKNIKPDQETTDTTGA